MVVANRLPVDEVPAGTADSRQSRSSTDGTGGAARAAWSPRCIRSSPPTAAPGSAGPARAGPAPRPVRDRRDPRCTRCRCRDDEVDRLLRGRSPTPRSGRSTTTRSRPRSTTGTGGRPTARSTAGSPRPPTGSAPPGATVWVQDYQLQLVPAMLRERRPDLRIGFFLHIPFPPIELFMQLPQREEIIRGLLGADLVGFQTPLGAQNFLHLAHHLLGLRRRGLSRRRRRPVGAGRRLPGLHRRRGDGGAQRLRRGAGPGRGDPGRARPTRRR